MYCGMRFFSVALNYWISSTYYFYFLKAQAIGRIEQGKYGLLVRRILVQVKTVWEVTMIHAAV